ncbi:MAG: hypothetical protein ABSF46_26160, partial [Terriglobia bacterium]
VNINATFRPTAHAVGYFLAPLRGFRSPGALSKRLWGLPYPRRDRGNAGTARRPPTEAVVPRAP